MRAWIAGRSLLCSACLVLALLRRQSAVFQPQRKRVSCFMSAARQKHAHRFHGISGMLWIYMITYLQILQCKTYCVWIEGNYSTTAGCLPQRERLVNISAVFLSQKYLLFLLLATAVFTRGKNCAITVSGGWYKCCTPPCINSVSHTLEQTSFYNFFKFFFLITVWCCLPFSLHLYSSISGKKEL